MKSLNQVMEGGAQLSLRTAWFASLDHCKQILKGRMRYKHEAPLQFQDNLYFHKSRALGFEFNSY